MPQIAKKLATYDQAKLQRLTAVLREMESLGVEFKAAQLRLPAAAAQARLEWLNYALEDAFDRMRKAKCDLGLAVDEMPDF